MSIMDPHDHESRQRWLADLERQLNREMHVNIAKDVILVLFIILLFGIIESLAGCVVHPSPVIYSKCDEVVTRSEDPKRFAFIDTVACRCVSVHASGTVDHYDTDPYKAPDGTYACPAQGGTL